MIYRFAILSEEVENFKRVVELDSDASFLDLHQFILQILQYSSNLFASFFVCDEEWERLQEITIIEMDRASDTDNYVMEDTKLEELLFEEGQRLLYQFDILQDRSLFVILTSIGSGSLDAPQLVRSVGVPPVEAQEVSPDDLKAALELDGSLDLDGEFYNDALYDSDELQSAGLNDDLDLGGLSSL